MATDPNQSKIPDSRPLAPAYGSARVVRSGVINIPGKSPITWDEWIIERDDNGQLIDRGDPRFFEHHPEKYDNA